jgi:hypothetical protein
MLNAEWFDIVPDTPFLVYLLMFVTRKLHEAARMPPARSF